MCAKMWVLLQNLLQNLSSTQTSRLLSMICSFCRFGSQKPCRQSFMILQRTCPFIITSSLFFPQTLSDTFPLRKQRKEESERVEECAANTCRAGNSCWLPCDLLDFSAGPCGNFTAVDGPPESESVDSSLNMIYFMNIKRTRNTGIEKIQTGKIFILAQNWQLNQICYSIASQRKASAGVSPSRDQWFQQYLMSSTSYPISFIALIFSMSRAKTKQRALCPPNI